MTKEPLEVTDTSGLTDADWAELNKLRDAYDSGGTKALSKAFDELAADPVRAIRVIGALFPHEVSEAIKDGLADKGITREDLLELKREVERKLESPSDKSH